MDQEVGCWEDKKILNGLLFPVGEWGRKPKHLTEKQFNRREDVENVQRLLLLWAILTANPQFDPGTIDGKIGKTKSKTVWRIRSFQTAFSISPDGVIEPNKKTWNHLVSILSDKPNLTGGVSARIQPTLKSILKRECNYPINKFVKFENVGTKGRWFGAPRGNPVGSRWHAGVDLFAPAGTKVHAVMEGKICEISSRFYSRKGATHAVAIDHDHGTFIARYGEVKSTFPVKKLALGKKILKGQHFAYVGTTGMLHFEMYYGGCSGALSTKHKPFMRRKDLIDPTQYLFKWKNHLP